MALINCPQCGKQVSDKAAKCPHCGWDFTAQSSQSETRVSESEAIATTIEKHRKKWPTFVVIGICLFAVFAALWFFVINDSRGNNIDVVENTKTEIVSDTNTLDNRYLTQDLRMWGLFGPVISFKTTVSRIGGPSRWSEEKIKDYNGEENLYESFSESVQFDAQGHFLNTIDGYFTLKEIAKKDGDKIIEVKRYDGDMDGCISKQWSYYPNGMVKQSEFIGYEYGEECHYFYNEAGELSRMEEKGGAEGYMWKIITVYTIKERDEYGNWTKRIAEVNQYEYDWDIKDYKLRAVIHEMYKQALRYYSKETIYSCVVINATELRLRLGPSLSADTFKWYDGTNRHPNKGEKYLYLGESGDFYKIDYKGHEVWVSKQYTYLE